MLDEDVFVGTIKKCGDIYWHEQYGDKRDADDFIVGHAKITTVREYADTVTTSAVLIRVNDDAYMWLDALSFIDRFMVDRGYATKVLKTKPSFSGEYFVDKKSLVPYFENSNGTELSVKTLRKTVSQNI